MLVGNKLAHLSVGTFTGLQRLEWLFLQHNQLNQHVDMKVFQPLASLWWL